MNEYRFAITSGSQKASDVGGFYIRADYQSEAWELFLNSEIAKSMDVKKKQVVCEFWKKVPNYLV